MFSLYYTCVLMFMKVPLKKYLTVILVYSWRGGTVGTVGAHSSLSRVWSDGEVQEEHLKMLHHISSSTKETCLRDLSINIIWLINRYSRALLVNIIRSNPNSVYIIICVVSIPPPWLKAYSIVFMEIKLQNVFKYGMSTTYQHFSLNSRMSSRIMWKNIIIN